MIIEIGFIILTVFFALCTFILFQIKTSVSRKLAKENQRKSIYELLQRTSEKCHNLHHFFYICEKSIIKHSNILGIHKHHLHLYDPVHAALIDIRKIAENRNREDYLDILQPLETGVSGQCFRSRKSIYIANCKENPLTKDFCKDVQSMFFCPIIINQTCIGVIRFDNCKKNTKISNEQQDFLRKIGRFIGLYAQQEQLFHRVYTKNKDLETLTRKQYQHQDLMEFQSELYQTFSSCTTHYNIYNQFASLLKKYSEKIRIHQLGLFIYSPEQKGLFNLQTLLEKKNGSLKFLSHQKIEDSVSGLCFKKSETIIIENCAQSEIIPQKWVQHLNLKSVVAIPIKHKGNTIGVLRLDNTQEQIHFEQEELQLYTAIADYIGILFQQVKLGQDLSITEIRSNFAEKLAIQNMELIPYPAIALSSSLQILQCNQRATDFFKTSMEKCLNQPLQQLFSAEKNAIVYLTLRQVLEASTPCYLEFINDENEYSADFYPITPAAGSHGILLTIRNIGEQKQTHLQDYIEKRESQRYEYLGILSSEIATTFQNILKHLHVPLRKLSQDQLTDKMVLANTNEQIQRAQDLTEQILFYTSNHREHFEILSWKTILDNFLPETADIQCKVSISHAKENLSFKGNLNLIKEAVMILLDHVNRIYKPSETAIQITTSKENFKNITGKQIFAGKLKHQSSYCCMNIEYTGSGLYAETKRATNQLFTIEHHGTTPHLAIIKYIIELHGGVLAFSSNPETNNHVAIYLPTIKGTDPEKKGTNIQEKKKILIVDDDSTIRNLTCHMLQLGKHQTMEANGGKHALTLLKKNSHCIDLILLDVSMPDLSGEETFSRIKENYPHIPVIVMSGYPEEDILKRFDDHHLNGILQKPFKLNKMLEMVNQV